MTAKKSSKMKINLYEVAYSVAFGAFAWVVTHIFIAGGAEIPQPAYMWGIGAFAVMMLVTHLIDR